ncbi:MAG: sugar porter family MFS transporter [Leadbetterella sp.]
MAVVAQVSGNSKNDSLVDINYKYVVLICAIAALGGVLFGFDLVIISGTVDAFTQVYELNEWWQGFAVGCINIGAAGGALLAGNLSESLGRKKVLIFCAVLFAITGVGTGWAGSFGFFIIFRMLSGAAVGAAALVCPMYLAEISPSTIRGRVVSFYQLAITFGLILAYVSNYALLDSGENNWRWMFSSQAIPSLLFFLGLFFVPESPRWLISKARSSEAIQILNKVGGEIYAQAELLQIQESFKVVVKERFSDLFSPKLIHIMWLGVFVAVFSQIDGQNSLLSYAPVIFENVGFGKETAFKQSVLIGLFFFFFTFVAISTIDKVGRKKLLIIGSLLLAIICFVVAICLYGNVSGYVMVIGVLAFVAVYAATLGPVTWVALSEIFPNRIRGNAMAVSTIALWIANFLTTWAFPIMKENMGLPATFGIHGLICLSYFFYVKRYIPETKGKTLEEIEKELTK